MRRAPSLPRQAEPRPSRQDAATRRRGPTACLQPAKPNRSTGPRPLALTAILAAALSACATDPTGDAATGAQNATTVVDASDPTRDCFWVRQINGFNDVDDDTVMLNVGASKSYEVDVSRPGCFNLPWATQIAVTQRGSGRLCVGDRQLGVSLITDTGDRCRIMAVRAASQDAPDKAPEEDS